MSRWKERKLGDLLRIKHGYAFAGEHIVTDDNGKVLVTPGNFAIGGGWKPSYKKFYDGEFPDDYILREGDLVVTMTDLSKDVDTLGFSAKVPKDSRRAFLHNQRIGLVTDIADEAEPDFLYWVMRTAEYRASIVGTASGSTVSHTSPTRIYEYVFDCPEPDEQRAIASVLSSLDAKIDLLHRQNKTLEGMADALFREWFVEKAEEGWEEVGLLDVVKLVPGGTPKTTQANYWDGDIMWISVREISENHKGFVNYAYKTITEEGLKSSAANLLPRFGTVISARGTVGKIGLLAQPMAYSQSNFGVLPKDSSNFFFTYMLVQNSIEELHSNSYGAVFDTITTQSFQTIRHRLPDPVVINSFEALVRPMFLKMLNNTEQITSITKLRDTLLPKLMSGEVRVSLERKTE